MCVRERSRKRSAKDAASCYHAPNAQEARYLVGDNDESPVSPHSYNTDHIGLYTANDLK